MADNFGLKIGVEGEREFKKALSEINQSFKVLGSEMKLVTSQFDKNDKSIHALSSRNQVLNKEIEAQKAKIETLKGALDNASSSFGENDKRTQNWQIQLNNAQASLNDMERELQENNKALEEAESGFDEAGDEAGEFAEEVDDAGEQTEDAGGKFQKLGEIAKAVWISETLTFTGELNTQCTADIIFGMHADSYWYAGGLDDWFLDCSSTLTADDLANYFKSAASANAGDTAGTVDGITEPGAVTLRKSGGAYPSEGVLVTAAAECALSGTGRVSVTSEYISGTTGISLIETSTSDDLSYWSSWATVGSDGKLASPNKNYIRFRITMTTNDPAKTPKITEIRLYDIPKTPYERIGYARPVVLDVSGKWEAVLENAYDIIVTGEINGEDTLSFKLPYRDRKRRYIESEKKIQIVNDVYKVRTVTDTKDTDGSSVTEVYAEAEFYDLTFSVRKEEKTFDAELPKAAMEYALSGTEWSVGTVNVRTKRTWTSKEKNALSILRNTADLHGGDLVFDCANRLVHLLTVKGKDSGALFSYKKNMKSIRRIVDTRSLVTRLYAVGAEGLTFSDINNGKPYVEDYTWSDEVRISTLDCSSFTNPYQMKEYAEMRLSQYAKPSISYVLNAMDLSVLTGYEREAWELGDYVRVEDRELGISVTTRIIRREYNLQEPWNTVLELSTTLKNLGSSASQWDNAADTLEGTSMVSNDDIREMVPFNLLRNSRADDVLSYWISSGFEADGENGASGTASFKAEGVSQMTKSLSQTVYPANRDSFCISAQIGSENLKKLSEHSQVGIEVVIEYEDGKIESRFIDLF